MARRVARSTKRAWISAEHEPDRKLALPGQVLEEYDRLVEEFGLQVVDAVGGITEQQRYVRGVIAPRLVTVPEEIHDEQPV
jgi:hypothetical protein